MPLNLWDNDTEWEHFKHCIVGMTQSQTAMFFDYTLQLCLAYSGFSVNVDWIIKGNDPISP